MESRMPHPVTILPDAMKALHALAVSTHDAGVPQETLELVHLRASQINGCSFCVEMHSGALKQAGESDERLFAVAAWRESPRFSDAERAALALAEAASRISDRPDPIPDELWDEVARHYDERERAALLLAIAGVHVWNVLNVAVRQVAGAMPV